MSNFLSDEEFDIISKIFEKKGFPKFHVIAFKTDGSVPEYKQASGLSCAADLFVLQAIIDITQRELVIMCKSLESSENNKEELILGKTTGSC